VVLLAVVQCEVFMQSERRTRRKKRRREGAVTRRTRCRLGRAARARHT